MRYQTPSPQHLVVTAVVSHHMLWFGVGNAHVWSLKGFLIVGRSAQSPSPTRCSTGDESWTSCRRPDSGRFAATQGFYLSHPLRPEQLASKCGGLDAVVDPHLGERLAFPVRKGGAFPAGSQRKPWLRRLQ